MELLKKLGIYYRFPTIREQLCQNCGVSDMEICSKCSYLKENKKVLDK